jgi:hypothetical protein
MYSDDDDEHSEEFHELIEKLTDEFDELGLYLNAAMVQSADPDMDFDDQIQTDSLFLRIQFRVGEVAWSNRILDPQAYGEAREFALAAPSEEEILLQRLLDEANSGELFDLGDDDEDLL